LANAELELSYTEIHAEWPEGGHRFTGKKLADEGDLLTANTPVLTVVSLDPLFLVVEVLEKDYPRIKAGQIAELRSEAWPGEVFSGRVTRIAPVLSAASRQARVELEVSNPDLQLKPGMFLEAVFVFNEVKDVWSVPQDVPFRQRDGFVIFIADPATSTVRLKPVVLGLAENGWVELVDSGPIEEPVVFLAQHLLEDGRPYKLSAISSPGEAETGEATQ
jgi:RND family efflux transporter MFP subunit